MFCPVFLIGFTARICLSNQHGPDIRHADKWSVQLNESNLIVDTVRHDTRIVNVSQSIGQYDGANETGL